MSGTVQSLGVLSSAGVFVLVAYGALQCWRALKIVRRSDARFGERADGMAVGVLAATRKRVGADRVNRVVHASIRPPAYCGGPGDLARGVSVPARSPDERTPT